MYAHTKLICNYKKGRHMKFTVVSFTLVLGLLMKFSLCGDGANVQILPQQSYDLLVVILEKGNVRIERYPMWSEFRNKQIIFSLDLSDNNEIYDSIVCNNNTDGIIVVKSSNEAICNYCLNWGAMVGVDFKQSQVAAFVPVTITSDERGTKSLEVFGIIENKSFDFELPITQSVTDVCAFVVPTELVKEMNISQEIISFSEACRLGIVTAKGRNNRITEPCDDREIELDRIIDSMVQDGTIKVKPVSPFMAHLRTIGSTIFVQYLAAKKSLRTWWKSLWVSRNTTAKSVEHITYVK